jgi:pyruvate dehydrogenase E2 component (dihydrolipoamide acetyltransferase)
MAEFVMPALGTDMEAGTLIAWRKQPGDRVSRGEIVAEVETDKAAIEVEIFTSGVIERILVQPGDKVPVGTVLALIREDATPAARTEPASPVAPPAAPAPAKLPPAAESDAGAGRLRISPSARELAAHLGVDPALVKGTGPGGAITREDIERAAGQQPARATGPATTADKQGRMRQAIAAAMARSKREIPHYYLSTTIDMSRALAWLADENRKRPISERLLYGVLLIKAVALALREVPELNAVWSEGQALLKQAIHVGVAISLRQGGLIAPALHDADTRSLDALMRDLRDLVTRARAGTLRSSELSDATITVTNLGEMGVETVYGVIYPPQVALVGFGKVMERPAMQEGRIVPRFLIVATLSADHRVSDGHRGGLFLAAIDRLLQNPGRL